MNARPLATLVLLMSCGTPAVEAADRVKTINIDLSGQLVMPVPQIEDGDQIRICAAGGKGAGLEIYYELSRDVRDPRRLDTSTTATPLTYCDDKAGVPGDPIATGDHRFLMYTVLAPAPRKIDKKGMAGRIELRRESTTERDKAKATLDADKPRAALLTEEIRQLGSVGDAVAANEIVSKQAALRVLKASLEAAQAAFDAHTKVLDGLEKELALDEAQIAAEEMRRPPLKKVHRIGGLVLGTARKVVYYQLTDAGSAQQPLRLERSGPYPVLRRGDELFAVVINVRPLREPTRFALTFTSEIGKPPDPAPVRPTVDQGRLGGAPAIDHVLESEIGDAYKDVIMSLGRPLKANEIVKVTISAYLPSVTIDKTTENADGKKHEKVTEQTNAKLVDAAEYPQVRDAYFYNLTTGVVWSSLRDPTFTKVKSTVGATEAETEYRVQEDSSPRLFPAFFFTFYWTPKDIQNRWTAADLVPTPTVGFSLTSSADNFFGGFQSEIRRNVQVVYGYHWGRVTMRGPIAADETKVATAPTTVKKFGRGGFVGLTFNINFVKDLFK